MIRHLLLGAVVLAYPVQAQIAGEEDEFVAELVHSDLPRYTFDWEDLWPRGLPPSEDVIAGCFSRVAFGDWKFVPNPANENGEEVWWRIENYGAFHCAANLRIADERAQLGEGEFSRGFFALIGEGQRDGVPAELWVWQDRMVPGSDYALLARDRGDGLVRQFSLLQRRCPPGAMRRADNLDIWSTAYCVVNSHEDMLSLARHMLALEPLGTLVLREEPDETGSPGSPEDDRGGG